MHPVGNRIRSREWGIENQARVDSEDKILALAQIDPGVAVLRSWQKLESKLIELIQHNGLMRVANPNTFILRLRDSNKITDEDFALFDRLRSIRNAVVHTRTDQRSISIAEVVEYDQWIDTLVRRLEQLRQEPGYINMK